jgi:hypothetical protein
MDIEPLAMGVELLAMGIELLAMDVVLHMGSHTVLRTASLVDSAPAYSMIPRVTELVEASAFPRAAGPYGSKTRFQAGGSVGGACSGRPGLTQEREAHNVALVSAV